jgi:hypothetical protein
MTVYISTLNTGVQQLWQSYATVLCLGQARREEVKDRPCYFASAACQHLGGVLATNSQTARAPAPRMTYKLCQMRMQILQSLYLLAYKEGETCQVESRV